MHLNFCQEMSFTHASTDLNFNFAAVNQVSGPLGKQKLTSTGSKGQVKRSRLSVVIGRFRSISFVFVSAGILIPRYLLQILPRSLVETFFNSSNFGPHACSSSSVSSLVQSTVFRLFELFLVVASDFCF